MTKAGEPISMQSARPRRVLITGGLGYLGSVLTSELRTHGFECVVYDTGFFTDCTITRPDAPRLEQKDARDVTRDDLRDFDAVVHFAAISNDPFGKLSAQDVYDPTRAYTRRIAELCKELGKRFIYASSCSVYGRGDGSLLDENAPTHPQTPYSVNKLEVEADLRELASDEFRPIAFRFATAYGMSPRIRFDVYINMLVGMAVSRGKIVLNSDGQAWRPNVHVLDICQAVRLGLTSDVPPGLTVLNVGDTSDNFRIIQVAEMVRDAVSGSEIIFMNAAGERLSAAEVELIKDRKVSGDADTRTYRVSFERIKTALPGFRCQWSVKRGITQLASDLRAAGLTSEQFGDPRYYRLQHLDRLYSAGQLTPQLRWRRSA